METHLAQVCLQKHAAVVLLPRDPVLQHVRVRQEGLTTLNSTTRAFFALLLLLRPTPPSAFRSIRRAAPWCSGEDKSHNRSGVGNRLRGCAHAAEGVLLSLLLLLLLPPPLLLLHGALLENLNCFRPKPLSPLSLSPPPPPPLPFSSSLTVLLLALSVESPCPLPLLPTPLRLPRSGISSASRPFRRSFLG
jgi:hypothetical protein